MPLTPTKEHHYAIDAATLLDQCRKRLHFIIGQQKDRVNANVLDLDRTLLTTEQLLHYHLLTLLEQEQKGVLSREGTDGTSFTSSVSFMPTLPKLSVDKGNDMDSSNHAVTLNALMETVEILKKVMTRKHTRKRSISFLEWHNRNEKELEKYQQQQQNQDHLPRTNISTIEKPPHTLYHPSGKRYAKALIAAQKNISSTSSNHHHAESIINSNHFSQNLSNTSSNTTSTTTNNIGSYYPHSSFSISTQQPTSSSQATSNTSVPPTSTEGTAIDSVLFRLMVVLQLCLVRIDEVENIFCRSCHHNASTTTKTSVTQSKSNKNHLIIFGTLSALVCASTYIVSKECRNRINTGKSLLMEQKSSLIARGTKACIITGTSLLLGRGWRVLCMNARLLNTILAIEDLQQQWMLINSVQMETSSSLNGNEIDKGGNSSSEKQCKRLLKLIPLQKQNTSIWESQGAFRYGLVKWAMDTLYASVGTAIKVTKFSNKQKSNSILMPIATAAAASYYALVGPSGKSAEMVSESESSALIRNAWGVVSLPAVKTMSLQASRLLKGAAIAERIMICGVPCFILSKDVCPILSTAIKTYRRKQRRRLSRLSTIIEDDESYSQRAINLSEYPQKDVIFHLTGGGFFAHTIAGDVPYLMDWSFATKAVVICPEYALLPEHTFPVAIEEVTRVYSSLVNGNSASLLGFQTNRIIVTGESTGGNLAASLCVKLCLDGLVDVEQLTAQNRFNQTRDETLSSDSSFSPCTSPRAPLSPTSSNVSESDEINEFKPFSTSMIRLPDAIMLCCPAINLSLELSPSRVLGKRDAVLPSSLISTISDAYVPPHLNVSKTDPIVSPFYAPDEILRIFPPTLLYASSEDPLLDDSIRFNARLRENGVDSDLRAEQNVPHAYWGLVTAGFPEARKVQRECEAWMVRQLQ